MDQLFSRVWVFTVWTYGIRWSRYGVFTHSRRYIVFQGQCGGVCLVHVIGVFTHCQLVVLDLAYVLLVVIQLCMGSDQSLVTLALLGLWRGCGCPCCCVVSTIGQRRISVTGVMYPVAFGVQLEPCCAVCRLSWMLFLDFIVGGWVTVSQLLVVCLGDCAGFSDVPVLYGSLFHNVSVKQIPIQDRHYGEPGTVPKTHHQQLGHHNPPANNKIQKQQPRQTAHRTAQFQLYTIRHRIHHTCNRDTTLPNG